MLQAKIMVGLHKMATMSELGVERGTLYRYVGPEGELRDYGKRVLGIGG